MTPAVVLPKGGAYVWDVDAVALSGSSSKLSKGVGGSENEGDIGEKAQEAVAKLMAKAETWACPHPAFFARGGRGFGRAGGTM